MLLIGLVDSVLFSSRKVVWALSRRLGGSGGVGGGVLARVAPWLPIRGDGAFEVLLEEDCTLVEEDCDDLRRTTVGLRLDDAAPAMKDGFFLLDLLEVELVLLYDSEVVPPDNEDEDAVAAAEEDPISYTELLDRSDVPVSTTLSPLLFGSNEIDVGARGDASASVLDFRGVFQVGVNILAVFDSCFVDSVRVFFKIGGGRDDPLLLPFSSSIVGADGGPEARLD